MTEEYTCIYELVDPRDSLQYWVGKANIPKIRLWQHINDAKIGKPLCRAAQAERMRRLRTKKKDD